MDETLKCALETTAKQVRACLQGLKADDWDAKPLDPIGSPREIVTHLCDVYRAVLAQLEGKSYDWGTYVLPASFDPIAAWQNERDSAVSALSAADSERARSIGLDYICLHDAYHVGQLCAVRLTIDPEWDSYSIYR